MIYVDTSAFLKAVLDEPESAALEAFLDAAPDSDLVSSSLLAVETRRGVLRSRPARLARADLLLSDVIQLEISPAVVEDASQLPDPMLRSLDAIHLASALLIREEVDVMLTYDERLAAAAQAHRISTAAPA